MKSDEELKKAFLDLPQDKQERIVAQMGKMLEEMKAYWKSQPENAGKEISYSELWALYGPKPNDGE